VPQGRTVTELVDGALDGRTRRLYMIGENAAMTDPDLTHVRDCLAACESAGRMRRTVAAYGDWGWRVPVRRSCLTLRAAPLPGPCAEGHGRISWVLPAAWHSGCFHRHRTGEHEFQEGTAP
jgi:hypothetical protein